MSNSGISFDLPGIESWSDLLRPAGWTFGVQVIGAGLGYGVHVLIGRLLGANVYGAYVLAMGWAVLLSRFNGLGFPTAVLRLIPEYDTDQRYDRLRGLLRGSRGLVLGVGLLMSFAMTGIFTSLSIFPDPQLPSLLAGIWIAPILALVGLETEILRAHRRVLWAYAPPKILRPLLLIAGIATISLTPLPDSAPLIVGIMGCILLGTFGLQYLGTRRIVSPEVYSTSPDYAPRAWLDIAAPLFLMKGFIIVITKTDIFVIGALLDAERVGIYGAALRTAHTITFIGLALDSVASSAVTRLHTQQDWTGLQELVAQLAHAYFWPTLLLASGIAGVSPFIFALFGPEFIAGRPELIVLMGGLLVNASTGCQKYLLTLTGHHQACAWIYGCSMVLNLLLNVVGVITLGTFGAALATAATMIFWNICMYVLIVQRLEIDPTIFAFLRSPRVP